MLDMLRKNAASWIIKLILGAIIISFAFFFGYNRISKKRGRSQNGNLPTIKVNDFSINESLYSFFYERNIDRLKDTLKGESFSKSLEQFAKSFTTQQIIERVLLTQTAGEIGLKITDKELADAIRKNPELMRDGDFDPIFYRHQYLPFIESRYGIDYENFLRDDLLISSLVSMFSKIEPSFKPDENISWTFERASISQASSSSDGGQSPDDIANLLISSPKDWAGLSKIDGIEIKKIGPVTIKDREKIFGITAALDNYSKVFALNETNNITKEPISEGDMLYVVRLVKKERSQEAYPEQQFDFFSSWLDRLKKQAKITGYTEKN